VDCEEKLRAARGNGEPVGRRLPGCHSLHGQHDQLAAVEIDGVAIMVGGRLVDRCSEYAKCGRLTVMVTMTRQMDMRPMEMSRSLGMGLMRMRHRYSAEKQWGGHEHDEEHSHDSLSLVWPLGSGNV